jgi:hypothetical protein
MLQCTSPAWCIGYGIAILSYRALLEFNFTYFQKNINNNNDAVSLETDEQSEGIDHDYQSCFLPKKTSDVDFTNYYENRLFFPNLYSGYHRKYILENRIDMMSCAIYAPIERYPVIARLFKPIYMVLTFPGILADSLVIGYHCQAPIREDLNTMKIKVTDAIIAEKDRCVMCINTVMIFSKKFFHTGTNSPEYVSTDNTKSHTEFSLGS